MKKWIVFTIERIPIIPNLLIAFGMVFSAKHLTGGMEITSDVFWLCFTMILFFLVELRLMDEYKDYDKDCAAHPTRPLPRGLVDVKKFPAIIWTAMVLYFLLTPIIYKFSNVAGILLLGSQVWLILMYKEFFCGSWLEKKPFFYAVTHQVVIIPLTVAAYAILAKTNSFSAVPASVYHFSIVFLSLFFSYEVGRKLDPKANPILGTYLVHYGPAKVFIFILGLTIMGFYSCMQIGLTIWLGIPFLLTILSMIFFLTDHSKYKIAEAIATINLIFGLWVFPLKGYIES
jgi:hypothetical protein